ncbi:trypsin-3 [Anastrepha ludens]|uniref:trypsin-3 n=1 Tax=Anastrepha ludens TaxID=28586 RepID=UPI0023AFBF06|nr:trypsin-3 [Anastrepha ludens]
MPVLFYVFSSIFLYVFPLPLLLHNVCGLVKTGKGKSSFNLFSSAHNHTEDVQLPKNIELSKLMDNETGYTMLVAGGYRPEKINLIKHVVSIRTSRATAYFGDNHFCVGSIISARLVLTAAHCVVDRRKIVTRPHRLVVVAGTPNRLQKTLTTVELKVEEVLPHNEFVRKGVHDIAILVLATRFPDDNDNVKVIPLANKLVDPGTVCVIVGWGQLFFRGPYAAVALHANLTVFSYEYCHKFYPHNFHESMICAGRKSEWDVDACRGDSGGPMVCDGQVAAIVSWSSRCGEKGKPTVFTSVYHHRDWINFASDGETFKALSLLQLLMTTFVALCFLNQ